MTQLILIFESIHKVLKAEQILVNNKIKFDIIPTPKEFSSDCGMSVRVDFSTDIEIIKSLLLKNNLNFQLYEKEIK
jgi:hypothetical protein